VLILHSPATTDYQSFAALRLSQGWIAKSRKALQGCFMAPSRLLISKFLHYNRESNRCYPQKKYL
jgi:hypothetical protein